MKKCDDPSCYNYNQSSPMYCDKCINHEINKMSYNELVDLYIEGKEWIDGLKPVNDDISQKILDDFKKGWFALLNLAILEKQKQEA